MELNEWYSKGMSAKRYIENMTEHKENLQHIYENFSISADNRLEKKPLRVIVLTEDWCGDAMLNVPILLRIAEQTDIQTSFLLRDSNLELMDQYLTNGKSRSIPVFIFIDENGNEVANWGPRAPELQARVDKLFADLPSKDAPNYEEKWKETLVTITKTYREDDNVWNDVYESIIIALEQANTE
ncbi:hypothetical protein HNR44_002753 [Geomicrobium halophilum]|uniref:Thioredoxin n=1 Tax=Geomicrobium halophilum TaxID=549000 RepID=A0A841Q001_9BACL|nr:thioredoxin family protein [Geomicrobium halophilum]MBB6450763.1 hypothetical protein [Geomicrobium halophilum]